MSGPYSLNSNPPLLKDDCDLGLQHAFSEERWAVVINLAKQLSRKTKDPYFETIEVTARSQLDTPVDQRAALIAVEKLIADNTVVKESSALDLYDWACTRAEKNYSKTLGTLRASFVKNAWRPDGPDKIAAQQSFFACIVNNDWENAQKIAAVMDQKLANESRPHFYNILSYFILSSKLPDSDAKKAMFRTLAQRLSDKARVLRDDTPVSKDYAPHAVATEEEMRLWLKIQISCAQSNSDTISLLKKQECNPLKRLSEGYVSVFKEIMSLLEKHRSWNDLFKISKELFERGTVYLTEHTTAKVVDDDPARKLSDTGRNKHEAMKAVQDYTTSRAEELAVAKRDAEARAFRSAVMDWTLWKQFIGASCQLQEDRTALDQLQIFISNVSKTQDVPGIYDKQVDLANLLILFGTSQSSSLDNDVDGFKVQDKTRINHLMSYVSAHYKNVSCFDDLKPFLEKLSFPETNDFLLQIGQEGSKDSNDTFQNTMILSLRLKFRYLFLTSPNSVISSDCKTLCRFCDTIVQGNTCEKCLHDIAKTCLWTYNSGMRRPELESRIATEDVDPFTELAVTGATSLLKLAGIGSDRRRLHGITAEFINLKLVLWAILWLSAKHKRSTEKSQALPVLLTKLYLFIGCVPLAKKIWDTLGVKNVTLDSLGPLFSDRLSTLAPGMWRPTGSTPMYQFQKHFLDAIRRNIPSNLKLSLEHSNYTSAIGLLAHQERLVQSCTMVMASAENRRGIRAIGGKSSFTVRDDPLLRLVDIKKDFVNATDTTAVPNHEFSPDFFSGMVGIGPDLSDSRAKLSLFSEEFIDLVSYMEPKEFKPSKAGQVAKTDRSAVHDAADRLKSRFTPILMKCNSPISEGNTNPVLTGSELSYFTVVAFLNSIVILVTKAEWRKNATRPERITESINQVISILKDQVENLENFTKRRPETAVALYSFASLHSLGMLRETALVVRRTVEYLERAVAVTKDEAPKWLVEDIKRLHGPLDSTNESVRRGIKTLNDAAEATDPITELPRHIFEVVDEPKNIWDEEVSDEIERNAGLSSMTLRATDKQVGVQDTLREIKKGWEEVAKGWTTVKLD